LTAALFFSTSYTTSTMEVDQFVYDHPDYLVLVAAGNSGPGPNTVGSPATAKNILAVRLHGRKIALRFDSFCQCSVMYRWMYLGNLKRTSRLLIFLPCCDVAESYPANATTAGRGQFKHT